MNSKTRNDRTRNDKTRSEWLAECACFDLRRRRAPSRACTTTSCGMQDSNITQFALLRLICAKKELSISTLGHYMVMDRTSITRALAPLERDGLIHSRPGADRRIRIVSVTNKGRKLVEDAEPVVPGPGGVARDDRGRPLARDVHCFARHHPHGAAAGGHRYLIRWRMGIVAQLLEHTGLRLAEIAARVGYRSDSRHRAAAADRVPLIRRASLDVRAAKSSTLDRNVSASATCSLCDSRPPYRWSGHRLQRTGDDRPRHESLGRRRQQSDAARRRHQRNGHGVIVDLKMPARSQFRIA